MCTENKGASSITLINYTENNYKTKLLNMQDKFDPKQASSRVYIKQIYEGVR